MCSTFDWAGRVMTGHCHANLVSEPRRLWPRAPLSLQLRLSPCLVTVNRQFANPPNLPSLLETLLNSLGMDRGRPIQTFARLVSLLNNSVRAHVSAKLSNQAIGNIFITKIIKRRKPNNFLILWKEDLESRILNKSRVHSFLSNHCL